MTEWFEEWFGEEYLALYPHRDEAEAEQAVGLVLSSTGFAAGWRVLDVACGAGRHARALRRAGARCFGVDLSATLLRIARTVTDAPLVRADMRSLPIRPASMDLTVNLFTSFGYFDDPSEQDAVIGNMARSLRPGGHVVLDYLNPRYADDHMKPAEDIEVEGNRYRIRRWTDGRCFYKRIAIDDGRGGEPMVYREQVARFSLGDFERLLVPHGLEIVELYGDYRLNPYDTRTSPRLVLIARQLLADAADSLRRHAEIGREHPLRNAQRQ